MGGELGQYREWNEGRQLYWALFQNREHAGVHRLIKDLNHLYRQEPALHRYSHGGEGFEWIDCHDSSQSIISYLRHSEHESVAVILNFTPVPRHDYRIGVPEAGRYQELVNSDSQFYGGSNVGNARPLLTEPIDRKRVVEGKRGRYRGC